MAALDLDQSYRRFAEAVFHRARRSLRDDALADDVVQETFLRAHKYQHSYSGGSQLSWFFTIADRVIIDLVRRRGAVVGGEDATGALARLDEAAARGEALPTAPRPMSVSERMERNETVARALSLADEQTAQILLHRYMDELTTDDIAARTGQSERTIRRRLQQFFARVTGTDERSAPCAP